MSLISLCSLKVFQEPGQRVFLVLVLYKWNILIPFVKNLLPPVLFFFSRRLNELHIIQWSKENNSYHEYISHILEFWNAYAYSYFKLANLTIAYALLTWLWNKFVCFHRFIFPNKYTLELQRPTTGMLFRLETAFSWK